MVRFVQKCVEYVALINRLIAGRLLMAWLKLRPLISHLAPGYLNTFWFSNHSRGKGVLISLPHFLLRVIPALDSIHSRLRINEAHPQQKRVSPGRFPHSIPVIRIGNEDSFPHLNNWASYKNYQNSRNVISIHHLHTGQLSQSRYAP